MLVTGFFYLEKFDNDSLYVERNPFNVDPRYKFDSGQNYKHTTILTCLNFSLKN